MKPHRGVLLLVFGIIGLVACPLFSPAAWIMGKTDLADIQAGIMDPEGESLTTAGKILGIIGTVLLGVSVVLGLLIFALFMTQAGGAAPFIYTFDGAPK